MASGFELVGSQTQTSPAVITLALPEALDSVTIGNWMKESGFLLSYNSQYLRAKNWIQICLMGEIAREKVLALANALERITRRQPVAEKA
jgi:aspartate aminotransferase-like enzyme